MKNTRLQDKIIKYMHVIDSPEVDELMGRIMAEIHVLEKDLHDMTRYAHVIADERDELLGKVDYLENQV